MENTFPELKAELLERAKAKNACESQFKRASEAKTEAELLQVIKDNLEWCSSRGICPESYLAKFTPSILLGAGVANVGEGNTGLANSGDWNSGNRNSGNRNSGYWNSGDWNSGNRNSGNWNSGNWNSGNRNSGNWNSGDWNSGYSNSGNWNSGYSNSGYSNSGDRNSGAFCTGSAPFPMFNKPSDWTEQDFISSKAYDLLCEVDTTQWVPSSHMSDEEKAAHPYHVTTEGYVKHIPFKEAFGNSWHNWNEPSREAFTSLPNFDAAIFEAITGVKI